MDSVIPEMVQRLPTITSNLNLYDIYFNNYILFINKISKHGNLVSPS